MEIKRVIPSGFCKGVVRAIDIALKAQKTYSDKKIYILGMIVHNRFITDALYQKGIITLDTNGKSKSELIASIDDGVIIFSAHGSDARLIKQAQDQGLIAIDATCIDVIKTQDLIKDYLKKGYEVIYIGKDKHPEAEAVLSISEKIHLIKDLKDIKNLQLETAKIMVTNQTTMSIYETQTLIKEILKKYPDAQIEDEICSATSMRQRAILDLKDCDLLYIVGDPLSNNTEKLRAIGLEAGIKKVRKIQSAHDIQAIDLNDSLNIYVTAGASTPKYLIDQVFKSLECFKNNGYLLDEEIDVKEIL